jgi:DNA-binding MarR family transcriptional regulator
MEFYSIDQYLLTCTKSQRKVFKFFIERYSDKPILLTIAYIADSLEYSVGTIKIGIKKFHRDGMIIKYQENGKFDRNTYAFTDLFKKLLDKK